MLSVTLLSVSLNGPFQSDRKSGDGSGKPTFGGGSGGVCGGVGRMSNVLVVLTVSSGSPLDEYGIAKPMSLSELI